MRFSLEQYEGINQNSAFSKINNLRHGAAPTKQADQSRVLAFECEHRILLLSTFIQMRRCIVDRRTDFLSGLFG